MNELETPKHVEPRREFARDVAVKAPDPYEEFTPSMDDLFKSVKRRLGRAYQRRCRGGKRSAQDEVDNLKMLLAWEDAEVSEGMICRVLGLDLVSLREMRMKAVAEGRALAYALRMFKAKETVK